MMLKLRATGDLVKRYSNVFSAAWAVRRNLDSPKRLSHELAFLPANLELAETPIHPAPHWAMRSIAIFAVLILLVGLLGRLDIVVSAKGKFVPTAKVKIIQPAITGVVKRILVEDGKKVAAGDLLIELDPTQANADVIKAHASKIDAALASARARAVLDAETANKSPVVPIVEGATKAQQAEAQTLANGVYREFEDKEIQAKDQLQQRKAELEETLHEIEGLKATAPLAREQAEQYKALIADKYVSENDYLQKEQAALQQESDLASKTSHADQLRAAIAAQEAQITADASQFRREQLDALDKADEQLEQTRNDETKAITRAHLLSLSAPMAGTVQQLAVHTLGGVVTSAQTLMEIVPDDALEVEAQIENKDIGFVRPGQEAIIKIEAFPYTRYGYLHGIIHSVSNDAAQDKKEGLLFPVRINIDKSNLRINDQPIILTPGMSVTAEIKTGKRSVLAYFFDPLIRTAQESMRER